MTDELLPVLEEELLDARRRLVALAERADALAALWEIANRVETEQGHPISLDDVKLAAAIKGEQARAELTAILDRILRSEAA